jgi:hypothetical protein
MTTPEGTTASPAPARLGEVKVKALGSVLAKRYKLAEGQEPRAVSPDARRRQTPSRRCSTATTVR